MTLWVFVPIVVFLVLVVVLYRVDQRTNILKGPRGRLATELFVGFSFLFTLWIAFHRLLIIGIAVPVLLMLFFLGRRGVFMTRTGQVILLTLVILFLVIVYVWALDHSRGGSALAGFIATLVPILAFVILLILVSRLRR